MSWNNYDANIYSPCKDCTKRSPTCHGNCKEYIDFRKEKDEYNAKKNAIVDNENVVKAFRSEGVHKIMKRRNYGRS